MSNFFPSSLPCPASSLSTEIQPLPEAIQQCFYYLTLTAFPAGRACPVHPCPLTHCTATPRGSCRDHLCTGWRPRCWWSSVPRGKAYRPPHSSQAQLCGSALPDTLRGRPPAPSPQAVTCSLLPPHHFHPPPSSANQTQELSNSTGVYERRSSVLTPASQGPPEVPLFSLYLPPHPPAPSYLKDS